MICTCGHEERHHDNEASRCEKIGCDCELFQPDYEILEDQYNDLLADRAGAIAALTLRLTQDAAAERDALRVACADALEWINDFGMHSPVRFGGEAELAIKLTKALGDQQND